MTRTIELDMYHTNMTVSQAVDMAREFSEAQEISRMINLLIFKQTEGKTRTQINIILGNVRRFTNHLEMILFENARDAFLAAERKEKANHDIQ